MAGFKLDIPVDLSEKTTDKLDLVKKIIHLITFATNILTICVLAPLIAIEARYLGAGKPGPNYALFVAITSLPVPFLLAYFPWMYEKHNKFKRFGKFCLKNRSNIIFCGFNTFMWATAGIAVTVHSNDPSNCAFNPDYIEEFGDDYNSSWGTQCNLAKVTAGFAWITCILWLVTLSITGINFWKEKTLIQERLNEHRLNKQQKLEERHQDEEHRTVGFQEEESPFADQYQQQPQQQPQQQHYQQTETSPFSDAHSSPYTNHDDYRRTSYTPVFDGNAIQPGQYAEHNPVAFSPMPVPQHMPPHPEPTYYNDNKNNQF
ncbi:hypothetical protein EDC94DRAFT_615922 [Helicostylum pulchrum]|uniref:MARVEL domain-containing protein n=1 Tax=Helicostylum pulchrum TaxID=562976 RepID=A0ABP9Y975_9FUNG|nr:hypothetical protein EDC94DRAFT_615922 [Helicostylum pulchrum]